MQTPNKGDSRWGSLFKNDLQGMLLPILLITIIGSVNILVLRISALSMKIRDY